MKRKNYKAHIEIFVSEGGHKCSVCLHDRKGEPYAIFYPSGTDDFIRGKARCWLCCRDAESTFLIQQKWPLAFDRIEFFGKYELSWSPGVKALVGKNE